MPIATSWVEISSNDTSLSAENQDPCWATTYELWLLDFLACGLSSLKLRALVEGLMSDFYGNGIFLPWGWFA